MSARDMAWTTVGAAGLTCAAVAGLGAWALLTQPLDVVTAVSAHDAGALLHAARQAVHDAATLLLFWL